MSIRHYLDNFFWLRNEMDSWVTWHEFSVENCVPSSWHFFPSIIWSFFFNKTSWKSFKSLILFFLWEFFSTRILIKFINHFKHQMRQFSMYDFSEKSVFLLTLPCLQFYKLLQSRIYVVLTLEKHISHKYSLWTISVIQLYF